MLENKVKSCVLGIVLRLGTRYVFSEFGNGKLNILSTSSLCEI